MTRALARFSALHRQSAGRNASGRVRMHAVRPVLAANARSAASLGLVSGLAALILLDWSVADLVIGAAIGVVLWGVVYFLGIRDLVPRGPLLAAPAESALDDERDAWPRGLVKMLGVVPLCIGATWLADKWGLGAVFAPGQFFGIAAAYLLGVVLAVRWERVHRKRALFRDNHGDAELYAAPLGL